MKKGIAAVLAAFALLCAGCSSADQPADATVVTEATTTTLTAVETQTSTSESVETETTAITTSVTSPTITDTTAKPTTSTTKRTTTTTVATTTATTAATTTAVATTTTTEMEKTTSIPSTTTTVATTTTTAAVTTTTVPVKKIRVFIDQGHNPHSYNTGAQGNGLREQDITFAVGKRVAELLEQNGRFETKLSRPTADTMLGTDNNSSLRARSTLANEWGADYFVSIHCNAHTSATARGIEVYAYSKSGAGYALGSKILEALVSATGFPDRGMKVNTDFSVLRHTTMPAVLAEMGFISHADEAALMGSNPELFAQSIYRGIVAYFS